MTISRREAIRISGTTLAGLSMGILTRENLEAQAGGAAQEPWPDQLVERPRRDGFPVPLPLNPDGSAPEHAASEAGAIEGRLMWKTSNAEAPPIEFDYKKMKIKVDTRGLAKLGGTLHFSDLDKLPKVSHTFLLQCGAQKPRGVVKWTGTTFSDFANTLGLANGVHYCRFIAADRHYVDESMDTLMKPQVMLVWMMNDKPLPPKNGAPIRLVIPFRYGNRSIKAINEIVFGTPSLPPWAG